MVLGESEFTEQATAAESRRGAAPVRRSRFARLHRGFWGFADQGVVSASSFVWGIILARTLSEDDFGRFVIIISVVLLLNSFHAAFVAYPLAVRGAPAKRAGLQRLFSSALCFSAVLIGPQIVSSLLLAAVLHVLPLAGWILATQCLWQLQETTRKALITQQRFGAALWGDGLRHVGQVAVMLVLARWGMLSIANTLLTMAVAALAGALVQVFQTGLAPVTRQELREDARTFYYLGRWIFLSNVVGLGQLISGQWMLGIFQGLDDVAMAGALDQLVKPTTPVMTATGDLILAGTAQARHHHGLGVALRTALIYATLAMGLVLPLLVVLTVWPTLALHLAYGGRFAGLESVLRLWVVNTALACVVRIGVSLLSALEQNRRIFFTQVVMTMTAVLLGIPLVWRLGIYGYVWAAILSSVAGLITFIPLVRKAHQHDVFRATPVLD